MTLCDDSTWDVDCVHWGVWDIMWLVVWVWGSPSFIYLSLFWDLLMQYIVRFIANIFANRCAQIGRRCSRRVPQYIYTDSIWDSMIFCKTRRCISRRAFALHIHTYPSIPHHSPGILYQTILFHCLKMRYCRDTHITGSSRDPYCREQGTAWIFTLEVAQYIQDTNDKVCVAYDRHCVCGIDIDIDIGNSNFEIFR